MRIKFVTMTDVQKKIWRDPAYAHLCRTAAIAHAQVESADPHAYSRMLLHLQHGYDQPNEVYAEAVSRLAARGQKLSLEM